MLMGILEDIATNPTYQGGITIIIVVASIIGVLAYFKNDKPKIKGKFVSGNWHKRTETSIAIEFGIHIRIDNTGERDTTMHSATLEIKKNGKLFSVNTEHLGIIIASSSSMLSQFIFNLGIEQIEIKDDITNSILILNHTHGTKKVEIPLIQKR